MVAGIYPAAGPAALGDFAPLAAAAGAAGAAGASSGRGCAATIALRLVLVLKLRRNHAARNLHKSRENEKTELHFG